MTRFLLSFVVTAVLLAGIPTLSQSQLPPVRERLGAKVGGVTTSGGLKSEYGNGWEATLYFTERIGRGWYLGVSIGAIYMGDLWDPTAAEEYTGIENVDSEMRVLLLSVGPQYTLGLSDSWLAYAGIEAGVYSVSMLFDTGIRAFNDSQPAHLGGNVSVGMLWRITKSWNIDLASTLHHFRTSSRANDIFYKFTGGDADPLLLEVSLGIAIDLR
jgi:hypothetical protein